jgi:cell division transport system permease protein
VKLADTQQFAQVRAAVEGQPGVAQIADYREVLSRLVAITRVLSVGILSIAIIMLASAVALIANTLRMGMFARRKEIGIMRLVGATNWHIRMPFLIEGVMEGFLGAGAAVLMLFIVKAAFIDNLRGVVVFLPLVSTRDVLFAAKWIIPLGGVVATLGSLFAMRRFLEV